MTQIPTSLADYYEALERLKAGRPVNIPKGTKITNDAVALEARRGKGSIKKSRPVFSALIQLIDEAAAELANSSPELQLKAKVESVKASTRQYREERDAAHSSLLSRLYEVHELKKKVRGLEAEVEKLTERLSQQSKGKVRPIKLRDV